MNIPVIPIERRGVLGMAVENEKANHGWNRAFGWGDDEIGMEGTGSEPGRVRETDARPMGSPLFQSSSVQRAFELGVPWVAGVRDPPRVSKVRAVAPGLGTMVNFPPPGETEPWT